MALKDKVKEFFSSQGAKNFISHLVQGLIVITPTAITVFVIYKVLTTVASFFGLIHHIVNPLLDPIIVIAAVVLVIYIVGRISASFIFTPMYDRFEKDIEKVPLIRIVYSSVKDLMSAFVGSKRKFNKPVLVTIDKVNGIKQIGFVTQQDLTNISIGEEYTAVYMPFSYGFSGKLFIVRKDSIEPLDMKGSEAMKFVVSGGVTHVD